MTEEQIKGQTSLFDQDTWSGKTFREHFPPEKIKTETSSPGRTSGASSRKPRGSSTPALIFLDLTTGSGAKPELSWETDGAWRGEYTTRSIGECPSEENASHLSQILEEETPPRYYLSAKACVGILRRASKRGKKLPEPLKEALEKQATQTARKMPVP